MISEATLLIALLKTDMTRSTIDAAVEVDYFCQLYLWVSGITSAIQMIWIKAERYCALPLITVSLTLT